jgi:hypothetical protein
MQFIEEVTMVCCDADTVATTFTLIDSLVTLTLQLSSRADLSAVYDIIPMGVETTGWEATQLMTRR